VGFSVLGFLSEQDRAQLDRAVPAERDLALVLSGAAPPQSPAKTRRAEGRQGPLHLCELLECGPPGRKGTEATR